MTEQEHAERIKKAMTDHLNQQYDPANLLTHDVNRLKVDFLVAELARMWAKIEKADFRALMS